MFPQTCISSVLSSDAQATRSQRVDSKVLPTSRMDQDFQRFIMAMQFQSSTHSPARFRNWHFSGQGGGGKWMGVAARPVLNQGSSSFSSPSANDRRRPSAPLGAAMESLLGADRTSTARTATNTTPLLKISILLIHVAAGS